MGLKQFFGYFPPVCRPVELVFMQNTFVNKGVCENMFAFANTSLQLRRKLLNAEPKVRFYRNIFYFPVCSAKTDQTICLLRKAHSRYENMHGI